MQVGGKEDGGERRWRRRQHGDRLGDASLGASAVAAAVAVAVAAAATSRGGGRGTARGLAADARRGDSEMVKDEDKERQSTAAGFVPAQSRDPRETRPDTPTFSSSRGASVVAALAFPPCEPSLFPCAVPSA